MHGSMLINKLYYEKPPERYSGYVITRNHSFVDKYLIHYDANNNQNTKQRVI